MALSNIFRALSPVYAGISSHRKHASKERRKVRRNKKEIDKFMKKYGGEKYQKFPTLTKKQSSLLDQIVKGSRPGQPTSLEQNPLYQQGSRYLSDLMSDNPQAYEAYKAPILKDYQEQVLPEILQRYQGVAPNQSSALQNELSRSGVDLGSRLGALRAELQSQGVGQALGYAGANEDTRFNQQQLGLGTRAFNGVYRPPTPPASYQAQPSWLQSFAGAAAPALGQGIGMAFGGPVGGAVGRGIGSGFGGAFQPRPAAAQPLYGQPRNFT
jgi:hypothetical protein